MSDLSLHRSRIPVIGRNAFPFDIDHLAETLEEFDEYGTPHDLFLDTLRHIKTRQSFNFNPSNYDKDLWSFDISCFSFDNDRQTMGEEFHVFISHFENPFDYSYNIYFCERTLFCYQNIVPEIVYVGRTQNNLSKRFSSHHKLDAFRLLNVERIWCVSYSPNQYSIADFYWAESQYISLLRPILNDKTINIRLK